MRAGRRTVCAGDLVRPRSRHPSSSRARLRVGSKPDVAGAAPAADWPEAGRGSGPPEACSGGDRVALADGQATSLPHVGEPVEPVIHTVRLGESIASIALRYGG